MSKSKVQKILRYSLFSLIGLFLILVILVRYTDGTISSGQKVLLGYDEKAERFQFFEDRVYYLNGVDGPYILGDSLIRVNTENELLIEPINPDSIWVESSSGLQFQLPLHDKIEIPAEQYTLNTKLLAISDIEGNFEALQGLLQAHSVIDQNLNWSFGDGHLVLVGDFVDRGIDVAAVLWLIYKLEAEALKQGGQVHFILGNHEILNLQGNFHYAKGKYKKLASLIGDEDDAQANNRLIYSPHSHLGQWLRSKNCIEKIGNQIFVHAGLSPEILKYDLSLSEINNRVRQNLDLDLYKKPNSDSIASFLMGIQSPFWYRGLVHDYKYYPKISSNQLSSILSYYHVDCIIIGHSIVPEVSTDFEGKVIRLDVKHGKTLNSSQSQGLLIEGNRTFKIDASGAKESLLITSL
ncbi:metallophosphoesterase [Croceimicrobium hydrocarbonivorans]|uniref:Metallophosphoesterase n=1 Tax=Croceimicrobium hydrocarbonivorans TaxID=2761580 RepID=A0A7H0VDD4_9FLAO|nr:metallophosphoesterase [Croceimicrobium hydrocarbonivorans]QNR23732.1 metallophosphoesterase [Croceimicrobium hydrocarbonivorans]